MANGQFFINAKTLYFFDEFGVVIPFVTLLVAIDFWARRKELEKAVIIQ